jgi:hypothetical protein
MVENTSDTTACAKEKSIPGIMITYEGSKIIILFHLFRVKLICVRDTYTYA